MPDTKVIGSPIPIMSLSPTHSTTNKVQQLINKRYKTALKLKGRESLAPAARWKNFPIQLLPERAHAHMHTHTLFKKPSKGLL